MNTATTTDCLESDMELVLVLVSGNGRVGSQGVTLADRLAAGQELYLIVQV